MIRIPYTSFIGNRFVGLEAEFRRVLEKNFRTVYDELEKLHNPVEYASNADALAGGLKIGDIYRNGDNLCIVHA